MKRSRSNKNLRTCKNVIQSYHVSSLKSENTQIVCSMWSFWVAFFHFGLNRSSKSTKLARIEIKETIFCQKLGRNGLSDVANNEFEDNVQSDLYSKVDILVYFPQIISNWQVNRGR